MNQYDSGYGPVTDSCKSDNQIYAFINTGNFFGSWATISF
jgi:hypothetical protein